MVAAPMERRVKSFLPYPSRLSIVHLLSCHTSTSLTDPARDVEPVRSTRLAGAGQSFWPQKTRRARPRCEPCRDAKLTGQSFTLAHDDSG